MKRLLAFFDLQSRIALSEGNVDYATELRLLHDLLLNIQHLLERCANGTYNTELRNTIREFLDSP